MVRVVIEELEPAAGQAERLRAYLDTHARRLGGRQRGVAVEVLAPVGRDPRFVLRVVAEDEAALGAFMEQPLWREFEAGLEPLVRARTRRGFVPIRAQGGARRVLVAVPILAERRELLCPLEEAGFELLFNDLGRNLSEEELIARLEGVVATVASMEPYTERVFARAPELRIVARFGVGFDAIDLAAARRFGVQVAMAFGTNHDAVADHAFALMAALAHQLPAYDAAVRAGAWSRSGHPGLFGRTVGIIGFGRIGRALAKRCKGFAMRILVSDPAVDAGTVSRLGCELVPLERLLREADFVSLHTPLTPETARLIDAERISWMKPTAYLINTARGGLVDEEALVAALKAGRLAGAALDVFAAEPPLGSPLLAMDRVLLTPHVAGLSEDAIRRMAEVCVENILRLWRGEPLFEGRLLDLSAPPPDSTTDR